MPLRLLPIDQLSSAVVRRNPVAVTLRDDATLVGDDERGRHPFGIERRSHGGLHFRGVDAGGPDRRRQQITHRPGRLSAGGSALLTIDGLKNTSVWPIGNVTQPWLPTCFAIRRTVRHRHAHGALLAIDLRRTELGALGVGRGEVADVLGGEAGSRPVTNTEEHMIFA